jgi:hypothetical protein
MQPVTYLLRTASLPRLSWESRGATNNNKLVRKKLTVITIRKYIEPGIWVVVGDSGDIGVGFVIYFMFAACKCVYSFYHSWTWWEATNYSLRSPPLSLHYYKEDVIISQLYYILFLFIYSVLKCILRQVLHQQLVLG